MQLAIDFLKINDELSLALRLCASFFPDASIKTLKIMAPEESAGDLLRQRKIIQSPWDKFSWLRRVSFLKVLGNQLPAFILQKSTPQQKTLLFTQGSIPPGNEDYVYLSDLWQPAYFLHILQSHPPRQLAISSQTLKESLGLAPEVTVIPPPLPTEDFPHLEVPLNKKSITILLPKDSMMDLSWLSWIDSKYTILVLGGSEAISMPNLPSIKWNSKFCHGTIHAAFLESFVVFDFLSPAHFPLYGLLALANRCLVASLSRATNHEFLPASASFLFSKHPTEILSTIPLIEQVYLTLNWPEMRRYALRFNEKNFKDRMKKWLESL